MSASPIPAEWYKLGPFTVFDLETTGMAATRDSVVEIAAIRVGTDNARSRFQTLVNPGHPIHPKLTAIHGIDDAMVADAPDFADAGERFLAFAAGSTLVAHNARFDLAFLQESLNRHGLELWGGKTINSITLVKQAYPGLPSYSLQNLRRSFALDDEAGPAHRAYADVEWTLEILAMSLRRLLNLR